MYNIWTSDLSFWTMVSWSTWFFMYNTYTWDLSFWTMVFGLDCPACITSGHQIFPSELWFLGLYLLLHVWHVYIRSFLLNYGFLVSTWSFMYDMCTSDLSFWTMVSWSLPSPSCMTCVRQIFPSELWFLGLPGPSSMTCVHQIFPSELWFLGLYLVLHVWYVYIRSELWFLSLPGPSCMKCVHQIFPSELWFLGLYLVMHVWYVYIRSFLLNYGFLVSTCLFMYDMCTSDLSFWTMVYWSLPGSSCMTCVHQIFPSELWFLGHYLVLHVWHVYVRSFLLNYGFLVYLVLHLWHVYIRSFLLNCGFLVSTWSFMYDMCTSDLNYGFLVYLDLHVWNVYIRSFLLNYGFLVSTWSCMYDMCTSDLSFWTMVSWSLPAYSCMTCVHQIFPSELWFLGLYLVLHVWDVYIRSFLLNYGFLGSTWFFMYDMCTSDLSFSNMVSLSTWSFMNDMCTSDLSFWTMVTWSTWPFMNDMCTSDISFWTMVSWST